jgi:hypothetical protein
MSNEVTTQGVATLPGKRMVVTAIAGRLGMSTKDNLENN